MATWLKQSTAVEIAFGPFLDDTDGKTAETGLTISQSDVRLKKNGGDWAQKSDTGSATHEENGWYRIDLNTTDTNTLGLLIVAVAESGALPVWREFMVVAANVYDSIVGGGDILDVSVTQFGGTNGTFSSGRPEVNTTHFGGSALTQSGGRPEVNTTLIEGSDATNQIRDSVVDDGTRIDASALNTLSSHDPGGTLPTGAAVDAIANDAGAIKAVTDVLADTLENDGGTYRFTSAALGAQLEVSIEAGITLFDHYRFSAAVLYGQATGMEAAETIFLDPAGEVERVTVTRSEDDRTDVALDASDPA